MEKKEIHDDRGKMPASLLINIQMSVKITIISFLTDGCQLKKENINISCILNMNP